MSSLHHEILAKSQRRFWEEFAPSLPDHWVLYGGTAIALRYGHRKSVDFDFFSAQPLDEGRLRKAVPLLERGTILERAPRSLVVSLSIGRNPIKVSFFAGLKFGRVSDPARFDIGPWIASPLDLLATKLKTLHDRVEARDYRDIEVLLRTGDLTLDRGIAAARTLFGAALSPLDTAKAVGWFEEGDLKRRLSPATRRYLARMAGEFRPGAMKVKLKSRALAP
jgi:hypothetical protein